MYSVPAMQIPENKNIDPCNPNVSIKSGKNFRTKNEHNDNSVIQSDTPKSLKKIINQNLIRSNVIYVDFDLKL